MKKEKRLKKELRLLGYSQNAAAQELGVSRVTINNWITGRIFIPPTAVKKLESMGISKLAIAEPDVEV